MTKTDYFFNDNVTINEGLTTGAITKAAMYFTKNYLYVIPSASQQVMGAKYTTTDYTNAAEFLSDIAASIDAMSPNDLHDKMKSFLPENLIYGILSLDKFTISSGWLTAGIKLKKRGGKLKVFSLKPRAQLVELKAFYRL